MAFENLIACKGRTAQFADKSPCWLIMNIFRSWRLTLRLPRPEGVGSSRVIRAATVGAGHFNLRLTSNLFPLLQRVLRRRIGDRLATHTAGEAILRRLLNNRRMAVRRSCSRDACVAAKTLGVVSTHGTATKLPVFFGVK